MDRLERPKAAIRESEELIQRLEYARDVAASARGIDRKAARGSDAEGEEALLLESDGKQLDEAIETLGRLARKTDRVRSAAEHDVQRLSDGDEPIPKSFRFVAVCECGCGKKLGPYILEETASQVADDHLHSGRVESLNGDEKLTWNGGNSRS